MPRNIGLAGAEPTPDGMDRRDLQHLAVALLAACLLLGGWWLTKEMQRNGRLEACLARRQLNCEQIVR